MKQLVFKSMKLKGLPGKPTKCMVNLIKRNFGVSSNEVSRTPDSPRLSYYHNGKEHEFVGPTIGKVIDQSVDKYGDRLAVVDCIQNIRKTFAQLRDDIDKLAAGFLALKLQKGDRIGIWSPNRYEWILTQMAAYTAGLILVPINPVYQPQEFEYCLRKLRIRAIVAPDSFRIQDYYKIISTVVPEMTTSKPGEIKSKTHPYFDTVILLSEKNLQGTFKFSDVMTAAGSNEKIELEKRKAEMQIDDTLQILFTSGTTGNPKAAVHTSFGMINNCLNVNERFGYNAQESRICCILPFFHIFGCVGINCSMMTNGVGVIMAAPGYVPELTLKAIEDEKCTSIYGTPTIFIDLLNHPNFAKTDLSSVIGGVMAGAPCPPDLVQKTIKAFDAPHFGVGYGTTEIGVVSCQHYLKDSINSKAETCGKVLGSLELKIVDPNGAIVPSGQEGEVCVRGYTVMNTYFEDEKANKESIKNNWFHTGDLGTLSEDGYIRIVGRIKDMIIRGGENIYPTEIEEFLLTHPAVMEAHIFGVPDEYMGEEVCAWIKLKENQMLSEAEVKDFCKGKLSHFKIPRYVHFAKDIPKTTIGKARKFIMQAEMKKILKL